MGYVTSVASDWWRYWRSADGPLEAMHAHFQRHAYHRHSHETYSFGVTEDGVQSSARQLIARGRPIAAAAAQAGFSDQAHLARWFTRCYGITPGGYQRAALPGRS
jgi:AraC-like DNA-binding protein